MRQQKTTYITPSVYYMFFPVHDRSRTNKHLGRNTLLDRLQLVRPRLQSPRQLTDLLAVEHARLYPGDVQRLADLVNRALDEAQTAS